MSRYRIYKRFGKYLPDIWIYFGYWNKQEKCYEFQDRTQFLRFLYCCRYGNFNIQNFVGYKGKKRYWSNEIYFYCFGSSFKDKIKSNFCECINLDSCLRGYGRCSFNGMWDDPRDCFSFHGVDEVPVYFVAKEVETDIPLPPAILQYYIDQFYEHWDGEPENRKRLWYGRSYRKHYRHYTFFQYSNGSNLQERKCYLRDKDVCLFYNAKIRNRIIDQWMEEAMHRRTNNWKSKRFRKQWMKNLDGDTMYVGDVYEKI